MMSPLPLESFPGRSWRWWLAGIVVLAVVLRLVYSFGVARGLQDIRPEAEATDRYHVIAQSVLEGHGYSWGEGTPPTLTRPPGYTALLLGIFEVAGVDYAVVQVVQALLGGLTCWLLFLLGRWVLSAGLGLMAAALFAVYPNAIIYASRLYSESLFYVLLAAFAYFLCRASLEGSVRRGVVAGILWGATVLTRGTLMPLPLLLPFGLLLSAAHRTPLTRPLRWGIPALLAGILVIVPWTIRNYQVTGVAVPVTSWAWAPMYEGNEVGKRMGEWRDMGDFPGSQARKLTNIARARMAEEGPSVPPALEEVRYDNIAKELVLADWKSDPGTLVARVLKGVGFAWFFTFDVSARVQSLAIHVPIFVLFVTGLVMLWRRQREAFVRAWPALGLILFINALHALAYAHVRYMTPAVMLAMIFAGYPLLVLAHAAWSRIISRHTIHQVAPA